MKSIVYIILLIGIGGCAKQSTTSSATSTESYKKLAYESLNVQPVTFIENAKGDYVLATYLKNSQNVAGSGVLNYVLINIATENVDRKGNLPNGRISWVSDYELEIFSPPGIIKDEAATPDDYINIYNVKTGNMESEKGASN